MLNLLSLRLLYLFSLCCPRQHMLKQEKPIKSICSWAIPLLLPSACPIPSVGANYFQRKTMRKKLIMQLEVPVGGGTEWVHDGRTYADQYEKARNELGDNAQYVHRVFVVGFVNDIESGTSVQDIKTRMKDLLTKIHADLPEAQLIYIPEIAAPSPKNLSLLPAMLPVSKELINTAQSINGVYVADDCIDWLKDSSDTWQSDQTHPNAKGHEIVAQKVESLVAQIDSGKKQAGKTANTENATVSVSKNIFLNYKQIALILFIVIALIAIAVVLIISRKQKSKHAKR